MNFYKAQDEAHRKTRFLLGYFILAIVGTILAMHTAISFVRLWALPESFSAEVWSDNQVTYLEAIFDLSFFTFIAVITLVVILSGWFFKKMQLSSGGDAVAISLGARPIDPDTRDPEEKQMINVVEEMAIASGMPVPQVWVMDKDEGINAFAAGTEPGNAVVGVTRGTIQRLNRAELQGVVAHEFSHILNGDMKMNIRLMSMLHGLLLLTIIGYTILRIGFYSGSGRSRGKNENSMGLALIGIAVCILIVGSVGSFFASLIQAAISRQREYLADASAVEFTMDPSGIAGALKKIGGSSMGGAISSANASEMEHMFLAPSSMFTYGMASHPPLEERIALIEPEWDGSFVNSTIRNIQDQNSLSTNQNSLSTNQNSKRDAMDAFGSILSAAVAIDDFGESSGTNIQKGQVVMAGIDPSWRDACHDKYQAQLLIYGLLIAQDSELREGEEAHLNGSIGAQMTEIAITWQHQLSDIHSSKKIALIDLCIPTLRRLSTEEYKNFIALTQWLIRSDSSVDLFEFMLQKILQRHLDSHFIGAKNVSVQYRAIEQIALQVNIIVSTVAGVGASDKNALDGAYREAEARLREYGCLEMELAPPQACSFEAIDAALEVIEAASPLVKKQILLVCGKAVMHDKEVTNSEAEMLRTVADAIGCAVPPFVQAAA